MSGQIILQGITVEQLVEKLNTHTVPSPYDPNVGFNKKRMMAELGIKSDTTFREKVRSGKIITRERGGVDMYFFD